MNEYRRDDFGVKMLILSFCIFVPGLLFESSWESYREIRDFDYWPRTKGTVVRSIVEHRNNSYKPDIIYRYQVDGQSYDGDWLRSTTDIQHNPESAQEIIDHYPLGREVDVFYSPRNPEVSYLFPPGTLGLVMSMVFTGILLLAFVGLLVFTVLQRIGWISRGRSTARDFASAEDDTT